MSVLSIENTIINQSHVTVTAMVEDMCLLRNATHLDPEEWAPALCTTSFELDEGEQIPVDENGFCSYLDTLDLDWELVDRSDWNLN